MEFMGFTSCVLLPAQPQSRKRALFRRTPAAHAAALSLLANIFSFSAHGYALEGTSWPPGSIIVLQLSLGSAGRTLQDGSTSWNDAVAPVTAMWGQQLQRVQLSGVTNSPAAVAAGDRVNSVAFSSTVYGQAFGRYTVAVTYYSSMGANIVESDTLFNTAQTFDSYRGPLQFGSNGYAIADIRRVFLHELGHGLGLGHPDTAGQSVTAVMNSVVSNQEVLSADDIAGGQSLYGAPLITATPTPAPTPRPTPTIGPTPKPAATPTPTPTVGPTATPVVIPSATPVASPSHLANISTRMRVGVDDNVLIGGFIIKGSYPKKLILRAIGPSLAAGGVSGALRDPTMELRASGGSLIASNDDWRTGAQADEISASGLAPGDERESALLATLAPGSYTAVVKGLDGETGIGLVEAYELDTNATRLMNISTRGRVGTNEDSLIGGLIVRGGTVKNVIVRALGPSLANVIAGTLADPVLEVRDGSGNLVGANDNWTSSSQYALIVASSVPPNDARESAVVATLLPGSYTAIVRGVNNTTGVGLVEAFDLDP